jgi:hypothetical protein
MSAPSERSNEDIAQEILKPWEELVAKENEELQKADERIQEAERKAKPIIDPQP